MTFCHYSAVIIYKLFKALIQMLVKYKMLVERFFSMGKDIYRAKRTFGHAKLIKYFVDVGRGLISIESVR
jgi:hypothetical protein